MPTVLLRAFRSAALSLQKPPLATRSGQFFHASARVRAADDSPSTPRDDGNKPEKEDGENGDENIFGETTSAANGESQGRKRAGNGSLRSRTLRNRKPEELPPVHVPKSFLANAISRLEDMTKGAGSNRIHDNHVRIMLENALFNAAPEKMWDEHLAYMMEAASWTEESLSEALKVLESNSDVDFIHKKGDIMVAAAIWAAVISARTMHGKEAIDKLLQQNSISYSGDFFTAIAYGKSFGKNDRPPRLDQAKQVIDAVVKDAPLQASVVTWFEEDLIEEIVASVNTDLLVPAPKNIKLADLRRPITIINISDYSGYSVPHDIVQHIGTKVGADVLHLRASEIAHIVGSYLGQDAVRAPGAISQLGYKAAENSGRLKQNRAVEEDADDTEDIRVPYAIVLRDERLRKENKKYISLMDEFLNGPNRAKNDELWEDLKVNAALEELVHTADSEGTEQRPLIVHIDDFNAINMDLECGAMIIGKIRKVIDGLWVEGRKIVLVGTCSTKGAPRPYLNNLRELESTERVTTLGMITPGNSPAQYARIGTFRVIRESLESQDYVKENESNIVRVLLSMVEPPPETGIATTGEIGMTQIDRRKLPKPWINSVLPLAEVYRIATTMIGYSKDPASVFNIEAVEKAAEVINRLEQLKERYSKLRSSEEKKQRKENPEFLDVRKLNSSEENHEERMESGLVNAEDIRTTFKDVHAPKETIESVKMLTTLSLIRPEAFSYGVLATDRIPGCLLYGPPGTGKTLLAKAVAKESGANMIEISGASINNKYVGESEKNVRALFQLAKKKEPMVIFIDEADALLGARGRRDLGSRRETINQFLREWDGMDKMKAFIMVATNRPFDLDEAVLRRLPRKLLIDLPLEADRAAILRIHLKDELLDEETVSIDDIAKRTPLYSGSDLKNVCVAAAMAAVKEELELEEQQKQPQQEQKSQAGQTENASTNSSSGGSGGSKKRRVLAGRHFDKALREIGASVSEDMATLTAIRKFDEKYGDGGAARRRKRKGMGFEVAAEVPDTHEARVRKGQ
ncbi:AAA-domain-containing protein [Hypoxylon sp. NC0597]|nr:AAA-domain-containing protein [Hypoxylon sp. NC0597]